MQPSIYTVSKYLKEYFNQKTVKLSLDGGFTCPNRDGTKGTGGCIFCSADGSGDFASTIEEQIELLSGKWQNVKYLAYFQNHTNTYAPVSELRQKFYAALQHPLISGIAIATRPDCISEETLDLLEEINENHFMWVELGLQTMHEKTANLINRCYDLSVFDRTMRELNARGIKTVVHLILGLPGECRRDMEDSVRYVCQSGAWGIKLHMLNVVKGSQMEILMPDYCSFETIEDYVNLVCDLIEIIPPDMVIHRLSADAPRKILMTPKWSYRKRTILNSIHAELARRGSTQGCRL